MAAGAENAAYEGALLADFADEMNNQMDAMKGDVLRKLMPFTET